MSAVRPRDPEVRAEPWADLPAPGSERAPVVDLDLDGPETPPPTPQRAGRDRPPARRPGWTSIGLAASALAAPWLWAVLASRLPLPSEQQGVALIVGWLGMAVVARVVADPRRDP